MDSLDGIHVFFDSLTASLLARRIFMHIEKSITFFEKEQSPEEFCLQSQQSHEAYCDALPLLFPKSPLHWDFWGALYRNQSIEITPRLTSAF